jgi:4-hydroxythreonine-4-phosphate dehydrogenase
MRIGITLGDIGGIGPQIVLKALSDIKIYKLAKYIVIGSYKALLFWQDFLNIKTKIKKLNSIDESYDDKSINILDLGIEVDEIIPGVTTPFYGRLSFIAIKKATELALEDKISAIVTCPISKKSLADAGFELTAHTEILQNLTNSKEVAMMFYTPLFKVTLLTIHIPLKDVNKYITKENILSKLRLTEEFLKQRFKIARPKIAICGVNPHAGESGTIGEEELKYIIPAIEEAKKELGIEVSGPYPSDTLFSQVINKEKEFDAILAMYHDQALIPTKLYIKQAVNITLGLPILRTSPAHGTAFDIAESGKAYPDSLKTAIRLATKLSKVTNKF